MAFVEPVWVRWVPGPQWPDDLQPWLPPDWNAVALRLKWRGNALSVSANHTAATFVLVAPEGCHETILVDGHEVALLANTEVVVDLAKQ